MSAPFVARSYSIMSDKSYQSVRSHYKRNAFQAQEKWENYFYNAIGQAISHADPSHLSDVIAASRELHQYRNVSRVIKAMNMPWAMSYMEHPKGDVPKANKARLSLLRANNNWQLAFANAMNHLEVEIQKPVDMSVKNFWDKSAKASIHRLFAEAKKRGINRSEFQEQVMELIKAA